MNDLYIHQLETENKQLRQALQECRKALEEQQQENKQLKEKINKVANSLGHELYGHILQNDEETWNEEFYTHHKLDYRKLLIHLLEEVFEILEVDGSKWYEYEEILGDKEYE